MIGIQSSGVKIVTSGLMVHLDAAQLRSQPRTGTTWFDLSGNSYNATQVNGAAFSMSGGASIIFDGGNDVVNLAPNSINTNASLTFDFWLRLNYTSGAPIVMGTNVATTGYLVFRFNYANQGGLCQLGKNYVSDTAPFPNSMPTPGAITLWTLRCDRATNTWTLLINGVFDPANSMVNADTYSTSNVGFGSNRGTQEFAAMNIYSFSYYNRVLSEAECLQNFNANKVRFGL